MKFSTLLPCLALGFSAAICHAQDVQAKAAQDAFFKKYTAALPAPAVGGQSLLKKGDTLSICGDSITQQKQYSLLMEMYMTVCHPELEITCRQHGWSGEQAQGFAKRMAADVLTFKPTVATSCYGMNDHRYVPYSDKIGADYRANMEEVAKQFTTAGVRFIVGSPGTIHSVPNWVKTASGTWEDLNLSLMQLRNIGIEIATAQKLPFCDTFWTMLEAGQTARKKYGESFNLEGKDGVHPAWAGQTVMAYAFLHTLGLDGQIGTFTWDLAAGQATATEGHTVGQTSRETLAVKSSRYPILPGGGDLTKDDNIRAGFGLVPFHETLNRFVLKVTNATATSYTLSWGAESHDYTREQLAAGVNLAADFTKTPLDDAYAAVWKAIQEKQNYETRQMQDLMHGPEGKADQAATVALTEKVWTKLLAKTKKAVVPVEHTFKLVAKP